MEKAKKLLFIVLCGLIVSLFATSCKEDTDVSERNKEVVKMLKSVEGNYNGELSMEYSNYKTSPQALSWTVDDKGFITLKDFPYSQLAKGVSKEKASPLYEMLSNMKAAPAAFRIHLFALNEKGVKLFLSEYIKIDVNTANGKYVFLGIVRSNNNVPEAQYISNNSEMQARLTITKLVKADLEHVGETTDMVDFDIPVSFTLRGRKM